MFIATLEIMSEQLEQRSRTRVWRGELVNKRGQYDDPEFDPGPEGSIMSDPRVFAGKIVLPPMACHDDFPLTEEEVLTREKGFGPNIL